jgi:hypothetical protein
MPLEHLTLQLELDAASESPRGESMTHLVIDDPKLSMSGETEPDFYRRKQNCVAIRHVDDHEVVAVIEFISPATKFSPRAMRTFIEKAAGLLDQQISLLVIDLLPPTPRDPQGIHGAIWTDISGEEYQLPSPTPLTMAAYEADLCTRSYVTHMKVGDKLRDMPLFLQPSKYTEVPLERVYEQAFGSLPQHLQRELAAD